MGRGWPNHREDERGTGSSSEGTVDETSLLAEIQAGVAQVSNGQVALLDIQSVKDEFARQLAASLKD
jgi:hypothetical protein